MLASEDAKRIVLAADFDPATAGRAEDLPPISNPSWTAARAMALSDAKEEVEGAAGREMVGRLLRKALAANDPNSPPPRCVRLRANLGMPRCGDEDEEAEWAWRADKENAERLHKVVGAWKADIERSAARLLALEGEAAAKLKDLHDFQRTLHSSSQCPAQDAEESTSLFAKYGSKIEALVKHVQKLQKDDPGCKIICFVQWEDLKRKISLALEEFKIEHLSLHGSVWARRAALMKFQYEEDSPRMLLLSLEESASGTNLTAASHVIIVHPMEASTREEAVAFEMQAIGRVRRPGQERKIFIWRFVTIGTIEQQITEEHQRELWERQSAKILVEPSDAPA